LKLGLSLGYWGSAPQDPTPLVLEAERLGFDSVWAAESYGSDAVTPLAWLAARTHSIRLGSAILQIAARSPAMTAMTAATLDHLSQGRLILGLGVSGPQVVEGWHGVPYGQPLGRTREYVEIVRAILSREHPLEHHGEHYDVPFRGGTGLGHPLKLILHPLRSHIPIYLAAIGPRNVALAAEIADGWLPLFYSPWKSALFQEPLAEGRARRPGGALPSSFEIAATVHVVPGKDVALCRAKVKPTLALYVGGMGARDRNFYQDLARRYGFEEAAGRIQDLYLAGRKDEAVAAVPDELVDQVALCGPREKIAERLTAWKSSGVTTLIVATEQREALALMAGLVL
jgi:F420-dependent oxidoreductase-like protein